MGVDSLLCVVDRDSVFFQLQFDLKQPRPIQYSPSARFTKAFTSRSVNGSLKCWRWREFSESLGSSRAAVASNAFARGVSENDITSATDWALVLAMHNHYIWVPLVSIFRTASTPPSVQEAMFLPN